MGEVKAFVVGSAVPLSQHPQHRRAVLDSSQFDRGGPADRVLASHRLVEDAAQKLANGSPGSGVKALCFAAATHLALTIGPDQASEFFAMISRIAREVRPDPEPAE